VAAAGFGVASAWGGTIVVTTLADAGAGSVRQAITDANTIAGQDQIVFAEGLSGTIELASGLDPVTESLVITGPGPDVLTIDANGHARVLTLDGPSGSTFTVEGLTLTGGATVSDVGGGIWLDAQQSLTLDAVHLVANVAGTFGGFRKGGGLFVESNSEAVIRNSAIASNTALQGGGVCSYGNLTVEQSAILFNTSILEGGGLWLYGAEALVTETTVAHNIATGDPPSISLGGGIFVTTGGSLTMYQDTIAANQALSGPGIQVFDTGTIATVAATIIAGNRFLGTGTEGNCWPSLNIADAHNLSGDTSCGFVGASDLEAVDPMLNSVAWAGGPTPSLVPRPGSPAVDAGNPIYCIAEDQRGWARPVDGDGVGGPECDLGAVELTPGAENLISAHDFEWPDPLGQWGGITN